MREPADEDLKKESDTTFSEAGKPMNRKTRRKLRGMVNEIASYGCFEVWSRAEKKETSVCEVFSIPRVNEVCEQHGLKKGKNYDLVLGDDLFRYEVRKRVREDIEKDDPDLVVLSSPCTMFSTMRRPGNDPEEEKRKLREALILLNFAVEICESQRKRGKWFLLEQPQRARSWLARKVKELESKEGVTKVHFDMCEYGMKDRVSGKPHKKATSFLGNLRESIMQGFVRKCSGSHDHQTLEGKVKVDGEWVNRTRLAQVYPEELCHEICKAIKSEVSGDGSRNGESFSGISDEVLAVESLQGDDLKKTEEIVRRCHQNLGHPSKERFVEMLRAAGASDKTLMMAKRFKCGICEAQQGPKLQKVSKVRRTYEFNVGVCCDTFELQLNEKEKIHCLNMICEGTNFQVVVPLWKGIKAEETRKAYRRFWKGPFGSPLRVHTDGGSEFEGKFQEGLMLDGTSDERSAAFAPWQNSLVERHGGSWKSMFFKVSKSCVPENHEEIEEIFEQVNVAKNSMINKSGYSPIQRVYGKQPRIPGMIYGGDGGAVINSGFLAGDPSYVKSVQIRHEARKAFCEVDHEDRVRRAIEHRTRPDRGPFIPGCKVYVWRPGGKRPGGDLTYYWRGPGTVIGNTDANRYWVSFGSKVLKCAPEQLRRMSPEDEAAVKLVPDELMDWTHQTSKRGVATYHDISGEAKPQQMFGGEDGTDHWILNGLRLTRVHVLSRNKLYVPTMEDQAPVDLGIIWGNRRTEQQFSGGNADRKNRTVFDDWRQIGEGEPTSEWWTGSTHFTLQREREEDAPETVRRVRPRIEEDAEPEPAGMEQVEGSDPSEMTVPPSTPQDSVAMDEELQELFGSVPDMNDSPVNRRNQAAQEEHEREVEDARQYGPVRTTPLARAMRNDLNLLDNGRPRRPIPEDVLKTELANGKWLDKKRNWKIDWHNRTLTRQHDWRRTKYKPSREECPIPIEWLSGVRFTLQRQPDSNEGFIVHVDNDFRTGDQHEKTGARWSGYTVFEFENMLNEDLEDDEIEVNEVTLDESTKQGVDEWTGKKTEMEKLIRYDAVKIIPPKEADRVRRQSNRILPSRFVITKKPDEKNPGKYITKARWCIRGYLDPDVTVLSTQSPTLTTEAMGLLLQLSASNDWDFGICDVEGAFLQGKELKREAGELYVELPPGGAPGIPTGSLLHVTKAVYGLVDAPKQWFGALKETLMGIDLKPSKLDSCLYHAWENGVHIGSLAVHVDDILFTGTKMFEKKYMEKLKAKYPFKHWKMNAGEFLGRTLEKKENGEIWIGQREYCEKLQTIEISRERKRQREESLTESEKSKMRGVAGALNWLTNATRPDLAAYTATVQQKIAQGKVSDIAVANQAISEARDFKHLKVKIKPIPLSELAILVTADASWTTEDDLRSQGAYMVCATHEKITEGNSTTVSPLKWKSQKQERAVSSTLAAELLTVSKGVAEASWSRQFFLEVMDPNYDLESVLTQTPKIPIIAVTDNKPLYDHIHGDHNVCQDKRLAIEILLLRRDIAKYGVCLRWIDTKQMLVDSMTKTKIKPCLIRHVIKEGSYAIMEEKSMLEAKRALRIQKQKVVVDSET